VTGARSVGGQSSVGLSSEGQSVVGQSSEGPSFDAQSGRARSDDQQGPERVFVLRHGRTQWNAERRFQGQADPPLDAVGIEQAGVSAALLATFAPDALITSDLLRASQTAQRVAEATGLTAVADPRLRERSLGNWEGLTRDEVEIAYPDEFAQWLAGRGVNRRGGESQEQVATRALAMFRSLPNVGTVVLVTHSATALALTGAVLDMPQHRHVLGPLANCHWSELQRTGTTWRLRAHNAGPAGAIVPLLPREGVRRYDGDSPDADAIDADALDAEGSDAPSDTDAAAR
jgi:broad specificity phosphatase PhoE